MSQNNVEQFAIKNPNYKATKKVSAMELKSFVGKPNDGSIIIDDTAGLSHQHQISQGIDFSVSYNTERQLIQQYRNAAMNSEIRSALSDIVNEVIVMESDKEPVAIDLDNIPEDNTGLSKNVKEKVVEEFQYILKLLKFRRHGDEIFESFFIDGRKYFHKIVDSKKPDRGILALREVDSTKIKKVREVKREQENGIDIIVGEKEYFIYSDSNISNNMFKVDPSAITYINSGLYESDPSSKGLKNKDNKVVISNLHYALRPLNQLTQLEDAHLIYTISRAPQRRVFYVDVGNLSRTRAKEFMQENMNQYKNKLVYDTQSGAIKNNRHTMSMMEDVWLPRKGGSRGTEVSTLAGGGDLGNLELLNTFRKKLFKSLNIPTSRLEQDSVAALGRTSEITRDEVKFQRFIDKQRNRFIPLFLDILRTQLILKRIIIQDDWNNIKDDIKFIFSSDSYFSELKDLEILQQRIEMVKEIDDDILVGKYFSEEYVKKYILKQSDDDIEAIGKQIAEELKNKPKPKEDDGF